MPVFVAMLRGVNVGGNPLKMDWLRGACAELGFGDVRTYLQSGNVVLSSRLGAAAVAKKLKAKIDGQTRLPVPVVVRTAAELEKIVAGNPFLKQKGIDVTKLHVTFLERAPLKPDTSKLDKLAGDRDQYRLASGRSICTARSTMGRASSSIRRSRKCSAAPRRATGTR